MKASRCLLFLLCSVLSGCATADPPSRSEQQADLREATVLNIEKKIADMVHASRDWEQSAYRTYKRQDIDGDRIDDAVLITTFEFENRWRRELFVCLSSSPSNVMHMNLGGKGEREADDVDITNQTIIITGKRYAADDAMCAVNGG
jgi:hypothetical protein